MDRELHLFLKRIFGRQPFLKLVFFLLFLTFTLVLYQLIGGEIVDSIYRGEHEQREFARLRTLHSDRMERDHFICTPSGVRIPIQKVNDDYCDCSDGSDEPKTDACPNGVFYCKSGKGN